jgi:hypothetical protein
VTNIGIVLDALIAAGVAGTFTFHRTTPRNVVAAHTTGEILMGYGAAIAFGCSIGAYFSGIASFSLHGWIWGLTALGGTWIGLRLRTVFGLTLRAHQPHADRQRLLIPGACYRRTSRCRSGRPMRRGDALGRA